MTRQPKRTAQPFHNCSIISPQETLLLHKESAPSTGVLRLWCQVIRAPIETKTLFCTDPNVRLGLFRVARPRAPVLLGPAELVRQQAQQRQRQKSRHRTHLSNSCTLEVVVIINLLVRLLSCTLKDTAPAQHSPIF